MPLKEMTVADAQAMYTDACTLLSSTELPVEAPLRAYLRKNYPHVTDDGFAWMKIISTRVFITLAQAYMAQRQGINEALAAERSAMSFMFVEFLERKGCTALVDELANIGNAVVLESMGASAQLGS